MQRIPFYKAARCAFFILILPGPPSPAFRPSVSRANVTYLSSRGDVCGDVAISTILLLNKNGSGGRVRSPSRVGAGLRAGPRYTVFLFFERIIKNDTSFPSESAFSLRGEKAPKDAPERGLLQSRPLSGLSPPDGRGFRVLSRKSLNTFQRLSPCMASRHCVGKMVYVGCLSCEGAGLASPSVGTFVKALGVLQNTVSS